MHLIIAIFTNICVIAGLCLAATADDAGQKFSGHASWYGKELHGNRTASGQRFDMNKLTAAHRTLPFGTRVMVKHPGTGKSVVVVINDRGPHRANRVIDISLEAARQIGIYPGGGAHVHCTVVADNDDPVKADKRVISGVNETTD